jgi:hypothetical protein
MMMMTMTMTMTMMPMLMLLMMMQALLQVRKFHTPTPPHSTPSLDKI